MLLFLWPSGVVCLPILPPKIFSIGGSHGSRSRRDQSGRSNTRKCTDEDGVHFNSLPSY